MKQLILILTFLITNNLIIAQNLLPQEGMNWKEVRCNYWSDLFSGLYFVDNLRIEGDTIFNGNQYKKLYKRVEVFKHAILTTQSYDSLVWVDDQFFGGIREDSQRVYVAASSYDISMDEKLIYDFSAQINDTIQIWYDLIGYQPVMVDSIYSITVADGSSRNKFVLKEVTAGIPLPMFWIEGIGSNYGLLSANYIYVSDESKDLRCLKRNDVIIYDFEPVWYNDCLIYPIQDCESIVVGTDVIDEQLQVTIHPNPMSEYAILKFNNFSNELFNVDVYDIKGVRMKTISNITNGEVIIDRENLSSGLYIVRLYSINQTSFIGKLLVE